MESIRPRGKTPMQVGRTPRLPFPAATGQERRVFVGAGHALSRAIAPAPVVSSALQDYAPRSRGLGRSLPLARRPTQFAMGAARPLVLLPLSCNHLLTGYHRNLWRGV